jgi:hypothetical protein
MAYIVVVGGVQRTCAEFGLPYFEHESFWSALCHHYQHMRRMSVRPAHAAAASKPQPKAAKYAPRFVLKA